MFPMIPFSRQETETYFAGLELAPDYVRELHDRSNGLPAYLAAIRRLVRSGVAMTELPEQLPRELHGLFTWHSLDCLRFSR